MATLSNPTKRDYHKPTLRRYGTINTLTQAVADVGTNSDGAGGNDVPNKTD